jgi:dUTP pyrophosphatase
MGEMGGVLSGDQLRDLIGSNRPLLEDWLDLETQIQPNGVDLTLASVSRFTTPGTIGADNRDRILPDIEELSFGNDGFMMLPIGPYLIAFNEAVQLPHDVMALGRPRSSLGRAGVAIHSAVWDAGYHGRSSSLLVVSNPAGFRVARNARLLQLVFIRLDQPVARGYDGVYQGERLS